jgi:hypothetical protein
MATVEWSFRYLVASTVVTAWMLGNEASARAGQSALDTRVRATTGAAARLLAEGRCRSPTLGSLTAQLERSDVVAFIEVSLDPAIGQGQTTLMGASSAARFLRVQVSSRLAPNRQLEILGHELQHAVEIAGRRDVRDRTSLREHYLKLGWQLATSHDHETDAAREVERHVRREIAESIRTQPSRGSRPCVSSDA